MESATSTALHIGAWRVDPDLGQMTRDGDTVRLDPRTARLILTLARRPGQLVSAEELLAEVWPGVVVSPDSVYQAIASLRRSFGDDPRQPSYIETVPRRGYKMVAQVSAAPPATDASSDQADASAPQPSAQKTKRLKMPWLAGLAAILCIGLWLNKALDRPVPIAPESIAVMPFLDITDTMSQEIFADGMAEELIGRFSQIPGFKVPPLTSSFAFRGKHAPIAEVARALGVTYVLGGSIRKAGSTLRVSARLIKADEGFIIWSETYDRPMDDLLKVQDDIADKVTKALKATIDGRASPRGTLAALPATTK
jgi:TolB-like protein/DNA-binding winged helix-turn-helix (wHTH) protein